ncbi:MAG: hypothetical protein KGO53_06890 [Alphaproteobacteria bacterium]|nr:hypothetical protein [Alphaproteobacteria bacterium]
MSISRPQTQKPHAGLHGGNQHSHSLASDWTFCEYYVPADPIVVPAPKRNIWGRIVSR